MAELMDMQQGLFADKTHSRLWRKSTKCFTEFTVTKVDFFFPSIFLLVSLFKSFFFFSISLTNVLSERSQDFFVIIHHRAKIKKKKKKH